MVRKLDAECLPGGAVVVVVISYYSYYVSLPIK